MARNHDLKGQMAVVTGASSGIGLCFCRTLAARGCDLFMISNQTGLLERCAEEIADTFGVRAIPFFCDLTASDATARIIDRLDTDGLDPDILINNAGIFSFLPVTDTPEGKLKCFIDLHVSAAYSTCRRCPAGCRCRAWRCMQPQNHIYVYSPDPCTMRCATPECL